MATKQKSPPPLTESSTDRPSKIPRMSTSLVLGNAPPMYHPKYWPQGCQTPDGQKMLVFSTFLFLSRPKGNFELFCQGKWEVLPDLHSLLPRSWDHNADGGVFSFSPDYVSVVSYAFVGSKRQRLLITTSVGSFELDIDRPEDGWSVSDKYRFRHTDLGNFMLVNGDLCFMDWFGWVDRAGARRELPYKGLSMDDDSFYTRIGRGLSWLSSNRFCVARSCVDIASMQPHLIIDVWGLDSENNHLEADEMSGMTLEKRFEFVAGRQSRFIFYTKFLSFIP